MKKQTITIKYNGTIGGLITAITELLQERNAARYISEEIFNRIHGYTPGDIIQVWDEKHKKYVHPHKHTKTIKKMEQFPHM